MTTFSVWIALQVLVNIQARCLEYEATIFWVYQFPVLSCSCICMYVCLTHTTHTHTHAHITHTHAYKLPTKVVLKNQASKAGIPGLKIITVAGGYCNCSGVKSCIF